MKATYGALDEADDEDGRVPPTTLRANKLCWTVETNSVKRELLSDVLPAPLGPTRAVIVPGENRAETSESSSRFVPLVSTVQQSLFARRVVGGTRPSPSSASSSVP